MLLHAATARGMHELAELDAAIAAPLPISRRIAVLGTAGGVGTSIVAGRAAAVIAARREGHVLLVDADGRGVPAAWHAGALGDRYGDAADPEPPAGIRLLSLVGEQASTSAWWAAASERQRASALSISDWGAPTRERTQEIIALSHVAVIVARAHRDDAQRAIDLAAQVESTGDCLAAIALVDVDGTAHPSIPTLAGLMPVPTVLLPHDRAHARSRHVPLGRLRDASALALLRLAASTVRRASESSGTARLVGRSA
ncbi:hypothetical protein [Agrococcus baldri]|nr:hypothetical protein [Agrococcus baldri]